MKRISFFLLLLFTAWNATIFAQTKDQICRVWYNQEKDSKLEVYQVGNTFQAKIIWLKIPNEDGKPKVDKHNPDATKRSIPALGLVVMKEIKKNKEDANFYEGGTIYDPKNGKTYSCRLTFKGTSMDLRGYIMGMPFLGRTSTWTIAE